MNDFDESRLPNELQNVARQARDARRRPTDEELDRLRPSTQGNRALLTPSGGGLRGRLVTAALTLVLVSGGGGAVIAASGGGGDKGKGSETSAAKSKSSDNGAARSQYCPPKSPGAGKPKNPPPGNKCGHP